MSDWHGWGIQGGPALHVGKLPDRKSMVLYILDGSVLTPLAYFRDEDKARQCLDLLDKMMERG